MGMVRSNQPVFTSPAHFVRQAIGAARQLFKPTQEPAAAPVPEPTFERPYDPVIDWEQDLPNDPPIVSEGDQWFALVALWWIVTLMAAVKWGFL